MGRPAAKPAKNILKTWIQAMKKYKYAPTMLNQIKETMFYLYMESVESFFRHNQSVILTTMAAALWNAC